ncbi:unnamed protein product [Zymoseptoria tritici ST99CH_1E4]|uniref:DUF7053 domain-containing protein n=1 Tax=Zymoseptoria tritici ST99CH_1E4 TaxID=1276532 RepID=A0A2H1GXD8_ZYMTR|nr:unnamed protein product [Zymoseptoria tritici ST99CH_1E4]
MGFLETSFISCVSTPIPADISPSHLPTAVAILQNYDNVAHLSENCTSSKRLPETASSSSKPPAPPSEQEQDADEQAAEPPPPPQTWEITEDLPFIPSWLWSGGTTYSALVHPTSSGCQVHIRASSLYTSTNTWKVVKGTPPEDDEGMMLEGTVTEGSEWYIQTRSEAVCNKAFVKYVTKGLARGTRGMHERFLERLREEIKRGEGGGG